MREVWKTLAFIGLFLLSLLGLAMTVCGGGFVALDLQAAPAENAYKETILLFALGSLVIGLFILYLFWRGMKRLDE
jgi:hypothetical protein